MKYLNVGGKGGSHKSTNTFSDNCSISFFSVDLDDVVLVGQNVISAINGECNVWEIFNSLAESVDSNASGQFVNELGGSNDD
jgi:hypothetical protein